SSSSSPCRSSSGPWNRGWASISNVEKGNGMLRLIVEKGEPAGAVFDLAPGEATLGRSRSAACRLPAPDISGMHAVIRVAAGAVRLENLSQFGTRVDGAPVSGTVALAPGQLIEIGRATVLRVADAAAAGEAPTGASAAPPAAG